MTRKILISVVSLSILILTLGISGCATVLKGPKSDLSLSSEPSQARVYVNGSFMGETPLKLQLVSKNSYRISFEKKGYETQTVEIGSAVGTGWIVLGVVTGVVPAIIDGATGAWYELKEENVNAVLKN